MLSEALLLISILLTFIYFRLTKDYDYWKKRGVKYVKPSFLFGNFSDLVIFRKSLSDVYKEIYESGAGEPYLGVVLSDMKPGLLVRDPEIIRLVLSKDFAHFHDRGFAVNEKRNPLSAHLFSLDGARWRALRMKLTPTFTSGKMKNMLPLMQECADEMLSVLSIHAEGEQVIEMREIIARFSTDIIGTCAFGVQCNSLRNPDAKFRQVGAMMFQPDKIRFLMRLLHQISPSVMAMLPKPGFLKDVEDFFLRVISDTVKYREENNVQRNDFMDLLIQIKKKGHIVGNPEELKNDAFIKDVENKTIDDFVFTDSLMAAQAFLFFLAGFETSSTTLSYALIELCHNPQLQEKLQEELDEHYQRSGSKFTYEDLMTMPYLDKVVSETLRMYPSLPFLMRKVNQRYNIPASDLVLEKDLLVVIPVHAIQNDPKYYPDPHQFDPERFSEEKKRTRNHYTYLPFGEGPRICIAQRFGLLQVKLGLATLLQRYKFEMGPDMKYPPATAKGTPLFMTPDHGTHLRIKMRS